MSSYAISELKKLAIVQTRLESDLKTMYQRLHKIDVNVSENFTAMEERWKLENETIKNNIQCIRKPLQEKIYTIQQNEFHKISDFKAFKKEMIFLQESIRNVKNISSSELEILNDEERNLIDDIEMFYIKEEEWSQPLKTDLNYIGIPTKSITKQRHFNKEVQNFMDFLHNSGGHENGWKREDHQLFLKIRSKNKDVEYIVKHLHSLLPDITEEEIRVHEEWYKKYTILSDKKKEAIRKWQQQKQKSSISVPMNSILKKQKIKPNIQIESQLKERLFEWKAKKHEQIENERKIELLKAQKNREMEEIRKKRNDELKQIVNKWRLLKSKNELQDKLEKQIAEEMEQKRRARAANKMIKYYRSQDDLFVARSTSKRNNKHEIDKRTIRSKSCPLSKRDPNRLLKPTKQWMNRIKEENIKVEFDTKVNFINSIQKLSVPSWVKDIK